MKAQVSLKAMLEPHDLGLEPAYGEANDKSYR